MFRIRGAFPAPGTWQWETEFRVLAWSGYEYVLGTRAAQSGLVANLPPGQWTVTRYDVIGKASQVLSHKASGRFVFDTPDSRAVPFHFRQSNSN